VAETTAIGAAYLAGLGVGVWGSREELAGVWRADREFVPGDTGAAVAKRARWREAVTRSLDWAEPG
jgi:glycerol kinase